MKVEIYEKIVKAAGIKANDLVLVQYWMEDSISEDAANLQAAISGAGAAPIMLIQNLAISQKIGENVTASTFNDKFFKLYEDADVIIDLMDRPIGMLSAPVAPEKMEILGQYMGRLFSTCASAGKFLQLRVPTATMAESEGLTQEEYSDRIIHAIDIDYEALRSSCDQKMAELAGYKAVTISTGDGRYKLNLSFEGRKWNIDAGDGDIPCGEINIAPIESATNGEVYFDKIYLPDPENPRKKLSFDSIVLTISNGVITSSDNDKFNALINEYEAANMTVCELGLGMNPGVRSLCGVAVLDEKMTDTFHLGIGDNTMFGGSNKADMHNDLIGKGSYDWKEKSEHTRTLL